MRIAWFCSYLQNFFLRNWGRGIFWWRHQRAIRESFLRKNLPIQESFLRRKFPPLYDTKLGETVRGLLQTSLFRSLPLHFLYHLVMILLATGTGQALFPGCKGRGETRGQGVLRMINFFVLLMVVTTKLCKSILASFPDSPCNKEVWETGNEAKYSSNNIIHTCFSVTIVGACHLYTAL